LKISALPLSAAAAVVLTAAIVAVSMAAQAPQTQAPAAGAGQAPQGGPPSGDQRVFPAPTNLKVLPKTLTGKQVRDVMEGWSGGLGVHCDTCHTKDPGKVGPNGWPVLNFADDSKHEKEAARLMYTMTQKINDDYVSMVEMDHDEANEDHAAHDHAAHKVTCGTCHRGHKTPEAYVPPEEHGGPHPPPLPR
jgi:hypothetical protein